MGTRSAAGVRIDGADKLAYSQYDGYWESMGQSVVTELADDIGDFEMIEEVVERWRKLARDAVLVDGNTPPTPAQIKHLKPWTNLGVSEGKTSDWYCLLRGTHGSIMKRLKAGYFLDANEFVNDSSCEYAYVLNLDDNLLELYEGYQVVNSGKGRYQAAVTAPTNDARHPVALVATIPLADLPKVRDITLQKWLVDNGHIKDDGDEDDVNDA